MPFVFTPDWAYVMGGKGSPFYTEFVADCVHAYEILKNHGRLFINLFSMVSYLPDLGFFVFMGLFGFFVFFSRFLLANSDVDADQWHAGTSDKARHKIRRRQFTTRRHI